ncbi:MAG TPA: FAD-dependent oxidoreductase, partial [Armatimonadetes bacterium]|nr:FAD-dependent oxidoreductase [Armatimonadota bacterium]
MTAMRHFDVVVIGGGPGGYTAAIRSAQAGLQTALIERRELGGTCLNRGCIPTKALLHSARVYELAQQLEAFGVLVDGVHLDYERMAQWRDNVVYGLRRGLEHVIKSNGIEIIRGDAHFANAHTIRVIADDEETTIGFNHAVIATGSHPRNLPNLPTDTTRILVAEQALFLNAIPKRTAVIGAGAVGVELAWWLSALGTQVTLLEWMPQILPGMDATLARALQRHFRRRGVEVITNARVSGAKISNGNVILQWTVEQEKTTAESEQQYSEMFDIVIVAIGR